jgi:hypothetical protein
MDAQIVEGDGRDNRKPLLYCYFAEADKGKEAYNNDERN